MRTETTDLIILGGGFAGLLMATEASRRGFNARVIPRAAPDPQPAVLLQPQALQSLARLDIFDTVRSDAALIETVALYPSGASQPALTLEYAELGLPFPFALAIEWPQLEPILLDVFRRYHAVFVDNGVEVQGLRRVHGRARGVIGRHDGDNVEYDARAVILAESDPALAARLDLSPGRSQPYAAGHLSFCLDRPEDSDRPEYPGGAMEVWLGAGNMIAAYPVGSRRLQIEVTAIPQVIRQLGDLEPDTARRVLVPLAPRLEKALKGLKQTPELCRAQPARGATTALTDDGRAVIAGAAYQFSPCSWNGPTQAAMDAAALSHVLSKCTYSGDFSRLALQPYADQRRVRLDIARSLANDLHQLALASGGVYGKARDAALQRLSASGSARLRLLQQVAGMSDTGFSLVDRLRLGGWLKMPAGAE